MKTITKPDTVFLLTKSTGYDGLGGVTTRTKNLAVHADIHECKEHALECLETFKGYCARRDKTIISIEFVGDSIIRVLFEESDDGVTERAMRTYAIERIPFIG